MNPASTARWPRAWCASPRARALRDRGLDEGASTRMLIYAGVLIRDGVSPADSCDMTMTHALTDDPDMAAALRALIDANLE